MKIQYRAMLFFTLMVSFIYYLLPFSSAHARHISLNEYVAEVVVELKLVRMELVEIRKVLEHHHR